MSDVVDTPDADEPELGSTPQATGEDTLALGAAEEDRTDEDETAPADDGTEHHEASAADRQATDPYPDEIEFETELTLDIDTGEVEESGEAVEGAPRAVDDDEPGMSAEESAPAAREPAAGPAWSGALLPRVQQLLTRIFDQEERGRFERFFTAAAETIEALGELELLAGDDDEPFPEATAIIDVLPAAVPQTLRQIESYLELVSEEFPVAEDTAEELDIDLVFDAPGEDEGSATAEEGSGPGTQALAQTLSAFAANLAHELRVLGRALEEPTADSDRWATIEQLAEFRGRARAGIGEMFFLAAREFAVVRQEDVVPFYTEDLKISLALRLGITTMRARLNVHRAQFERLIQQGDTGALRDCIAGFHQVFDNFMNSEAFRSLRVVDRRSCTTLRRDLEDLLEEETAPKRQFETTVEGLTGFIDSLTLVNQRELLIIHDREAIANTLSHLDVVQDAVISNDVGAAREAFDRAVNTAWPLFGREPTFDGLLKLLRFVEHSELELDDTLALAALMRRQL